MLNKNIVSVAVILVVLILIAAAFTMWRPDVTPNGATLTPSPTPILNGDETPDPGESRNISIESPEAQQAIGLPLVVEGQARVFENTLQVRLRDANGDILVERTTMSDAPDVGQFGSYRVELYYDQPTGGSGVVEAFQYSARDGSEIDMVSVPVRFTDVESTEVRVYFSNRQRDPDMNNCEVTYPVVRRIPATLAVGRAALDQLLMGPTNTEGEEGFFTNITAGVQINSLEIENSTARVDFSEALREGAAGSCLVQAIRSQITNTLTQFDTVTDVVISINGDTEDVLQP